MTCVAAIGNPITERGWIAADSCSSRGLEQSKAKEDPKIWKVQTQNVAWLMGASGIPGFAATARFAIAEPVSKLDTPADPEHMIEFLFMKYIPLLRDAAQVYSAHSQKDGRPQNEGVLLLVIRGRLYTIDNLYSPTQINDEYAAIGSGEEVAIGVLDEQQRIIGQRRLSKKMLPSERLAHALESASKYCKGVGGRVDYLSI